MEAAGCRRSKLAATLSRHSPGEPSWIDWESLGDGPVGLIAERLLAHDVADYLRFRAVCSLWRQYTAEPRSHSSLDRRFHPRRWILLREPLAHTSRRRFLNLSTGECIKVYLPELADHHALAVTPEGLLVLLHDDRTHVSLLNPLTRHLTQLPQITTLLPQEVQDHFLHTTAFNYYFPAWGSGILNDDSTVVLCFSRLNIIGLAKPGDARWKLLKFNDQMQTTSLVFAGRFYCVTSGGVMVLEDQPPRLELAAKLPRGLITYMDSLHLADNAGELVLVHRSFSRYQESYSMAKITYDAYRVDLYRRTLCRVNSFGGGGHALFLGTKCSLFVPIKVFPTGSIRGDTIYLSFDVEERCSMEGYHLVHGSTTPAACNILNRRSVAQPHTLVDCLSFCCNNRI